MLQRLLGCAAAVVVALLPLCASARPTTPAGGLDRFLFGGADPNSGRPVGTLATAQAATTWFGGTSWAADSARWEAHPDGIWTFDTGVASSFSAYPDANPFKAAGLHTLMEGWVGVDNTFSDLPYFRRISGATGEPVCVINGAASMYCGVFQSEADALCYAAGSGYGNSWYVCINHETNFIHTAGQGVTLQYNYVNDTEPGWDYTYVLVDTTGAGDGSGDAQALSYTGPSSDAANLTLAEGALMRSTTGPFNVKFCVFSDGAYSDQDGLYATSCGAFAVDEVVIKEGATAIHTANFETTNDGWILAPAVAGLGGDWSNLVSQSDLPPAVSPCGCDFMKDGKDTVLVFEDLTIGGHCVYQDNVAMSPWIDLLAAGRVGAPQKIFRYDGYFELPLLNYVFVQAVAQWYPEICSSTGKIVTSSITSDGFVRYYGGVPTCRQYNPGADSAAYLSFASVIAAGAEQVRIGLGTLSYCRYYGNCTGVTNSTPWFDNVCLGVAGTPGAPVLSTRTTDRPQDSFPENGTLRINSAGRIDCNTINGFSTPEPYSSMGDTLIVNGASGGAEVWVQFSVRPGPYCAGAVNTWLASNASRIAFQESKGGLNWYAARMDTAEQWGKITANRWMTAYHEDGGLVGKDTDRDPNDLDPNGGMTRLKNDIFPDNLFTPGTRVNLFYKTRYLQGSAWGIEPDTTGGLYYEMEVLPSSMAADSTSNCILYVNHGTGSGAREIIEPALREVLAGSSANFEGVPWDRWDVQAPTSQQASFGRPLGTEYGATFTQAFNYDAILWNSADLPAFNLVKEDADVLIPWLLVHDYWTGWMPRRLYLSGDGLSQSITQEAASEPSALRLLNEFCGVSFTCGTLRDAACPASSGIADATPCIPADPVNGARAAGALPGGRALQHLAQGNGCPESRSFDVLNVYSGARGSPQSDEQYTAPLKGAVSFASITNEITGDPDYKTVVDGFSVHYRRDPSLCTYVTGRSPEPAVEERLREVVGWFSCLDYPPSCCQPPAITGLPGDYDETRWQTVLLGVAPNPLVSAAGGMVRFTLRRQTRVTVDLHDVAGRLVRTLFDGVGSRGENELRWDGTDQAGRPAAGGVYFLRLRADGEESAQRLVVVRGGR